MENIQSKLSKWQEEHKRPIHVGMAGIGAFGMGILSKLTEMKGIEVSIVKDTTVERGVKAFKDVGYSDEDIIFADSQKDVQKAIEAGKRVVVEDGMLIPESMVDAVVDSTGFPDFGAQFAFESIQNGKHVVMVNLEADAVVGSTLGILAERAGVVYTVADGDQPSHIKGLVDWAQALEFDVVAAGKGAHIYPDFKGKMWNSMTDSYMDGSKGQEEMACVANMTGFVPDVPGMHNRSMCIEEMPNVLRPVEDGGILSRVGVIETVNCLSDDPSTISPEYWEERTYDNYDDVLKMRKIINPYVCTFIIMKAVNKQVAEYMKHKQGMFMDESNRYGLVYRPHQIGGIEVPTSVLRAVLYNEATGVPLAKPVVDCIAIAKRDIEKGEMLDGIGGRMIKAQIEEYPVSLSGRYLPYGMANNVFVRERIPKGTRITYDMLEKPGQSFIWHLRGLQDIRNGRIG